MPDFTIKSNGVFIAPGEKNLPQSLSIDITLRGVLDEKPFDIPVEILISNTGISITPTELVGAGMLVEIWNGVFQVHVWTPERILSDFKDKAVAENTLVELGESGEDPITIVFSETPEKWNAYLSEWNKL